MLSTNDALNESRRVAIEGKRRGGEEEEEEEKAAGDFFFTREVYIKTV